LLLFAADATIEHARIKVRPIEQVSDALMPLPKRNWLEMTWQDIAGARTERWIAVLPLAAIEQHGPHLPLGVDSFIAGAYLGRVRELLPDDLPVTFLPIQQVGISTEHLAYPGTLTFSAQTAIAAWTELGESLARAGLRKLVFVTSHGGNVAAMELAARDLRARLRMLAVTVGWHRFGYPDGVFSGEEKKHGIHAGEIETSLMLTAKSSMVQMQKAARATPETIAMAQEFKWLGAYRPAGFAWMTQDLNPTGAVGDGRSAKADKGEAALAQGAKAFVELLREIDRFDLSRLREGPLAD
jgi:creatinine amidohydrolase